MAMALAGRKSGTLADINVTPMIDVLLVLLIIFMVVQQGMQRGLAVQVPPAAESPPAGSPEQFVLEVRPGPEYLLNGQPIDPARLEPRLREVFAPRARRVVFVKGAESLSYGQVVHALDATRAAGVEVTGVVPRTPERRPGRAVAEGGGTR